MLPEWLCLFCVRRHRKYLTIQL
ncbi:hypothetical protein MTBSS4_40165 [Magnetospirillum sp. SS-4]|nr:hypothetical protein MTBSS4_40165 [Magnetospirillum sp. SS-4]